MTIATQKTLQKYKNEIKWGQQEELPMTQGLAITNVIERYDIPAKQWGYSGSLIGIETKKQYLFWRDRGSELEFKGIINKK